MGVAHMDLDILANSHVQMGVAYKNLEILAHSHAQMSVAYTDLEFLALILQLNADHKGAQTYPNFVFRQPLCDVTSHSSCILQIPLKFYIHHCHCCLCLRLALRPMYSQGCLRDPHCCCQHPTTGSVLLGHDKVLAPELFLESAPAEPPVPSSSAGLFGPSPAIHLSSSKQDPRQ
jgi:hypothetical protein